MAGITRATGGVSLQRLSIQPPKASAAGLVRKADGTPRIAEDVDPNQLDDRVKQMLTADERKQLGIPY